MQEEERAQAKKTRKASSESLWDPLRWGLMPEMSEALPERLQDLWTEYARCFKTKTRDTSEYAYHYLDGLLRLECKRNYTVIGRATGIAGENMQHFMSNSPWQTYKVLTQVREDVRTMPGLEQGNMLRLDESADVAGEKKAGAGRQYSGRRGKVDLSQVGVFLAFANLTRPDRPLWTWIDGELYLQERWFTPEMDDLRDQVGIPSDLVFETKVEKGWRMIQRAQAQGLPFEAVACDDLYGRSQWLRDAMNAAGILYVADVPRNTKVYLEKPMLDDVEQFSVHEVARRADTRWHRIRVRAIERGELDDPFAVRRV